MIVPDSNLRSSRPLRPVRTRDRGETRVLFRLAAGTLLFLAASWFIWVYSRIEAVAHSDDVQTADAIVVFGAAEYDGRPSPVLHARLDHALELYQRGMAPLIVTLGGGRDAGTDRDNPKSEGAVGRDYLLANGVPEHNVIAETQSSDTEESIARLAMIARENHLQRVIVVSDRTHLFRIGELCRSAGLQVFTSPRPEVGHISILDRALRVWHEMLSYTAWRLHLH